MYILFLRCAIFFFIAFQLSSAKIHFLTLTDEFRRNILLSKFGFNANGTFDFVLSNFTVPDAVVPPQVEKDNKYGFIGFTLSRSNVIAEGIHSNPHVCQLQQHDQGIDALFFVFDFSKNQLIVTGSGGIQDIELCSSSDECPSPGEQQDNNKKEKKGVKGILSNIFSSAESVSIAYQSYIPLKVVNGQYSAKFGIRFKPGQEGLYHFLYHNCFNYRAHGYSDRVAVDFSISIVERNIGSYLSAGDIAKPTMYFYMSFLFALACVLWCNTLCKSDSKNVFRVHKLMTTLIVLKILALFFHGMNYFFVSEYGHQREIWAIIYYVIHLLKGAILFGTIILIGTGYTFFKNFLTDRDRNLFIFVLPLQVIDNIAMVIMEESEFGDLRYSFWFEIFIFLDLLCCMTILFPIIWSMHHLREGARTDGKAAFNLEKLHLFRHFYLIVIFYIYSTRLTKFIVEYILPFNYQWISEAIVELSTLFFFCLVGIKFKPSRGNPYLRLSQADGDSDPESSMALTTNGLYENVSRVQRISVQDELNDIPGGIGGHGDSDDDNEDDDKAALMPTASKDSSHMIL